MRKVIQAMFQAKELVTTEDDINKLAETWQLIIEDIQLKKPLTEKKVKVPIIQK